MHNQADTANFGLTPGVEYWLKPYISGKYTLAPITAAMPAQSLGATN